MEYDIIHLLKRVNDGIEREGNASLKPMNLTLSQCAILSYLSMQENQLSPLKTIEKTFQVSQATMQGTIARLEKKNLIELLNDPGDKRIKLAHLTTLGKDLFQQADTYRLASEKKFFADLDETDRDTLKALLLKIHNKLY